MISNVHKGFLFSDIIWCCNSYNSACKNSMIFWEIKYHQKIAKKLKLKLKALNHHHIFIMHGIHIHIDR
jgi:hypothetical protein